MSDKLILASASPRRLDLLKQVGVTPDIILPADIDETPFKKEKAREHCLRLAIGKAELIHKQHPESFVLGADTVVSLGARILPKAENIDTARECINLLSGRKHRVYGGIALFSPSGKLSKRVVTSFVSFKKLSSSEIEYYLESNDWEGKAGGYAIQGIAAQFIKSLNGSYTNIVGLSLYDTMNMLKGTGYVKI